MPDDNIIRPVFGGPRAAASALRAEGEPAGVPPQAQPLAPLRVLGTGAGHRVGLVRDPSAEEGAVIRVVIGPEDEAAVETVALLPATADADAEAERVGFAILRALEVVEGAL
jgi:hypothetical protein